MVSSFITDNTGDIIYQAGRTKRKLSFISFDLDKLAYDRLHGDYSEIEDQTYMRRRYVRSCNNWEVYYEETGYRHACAC